MKEIKKPENTIFYSNYKDMIYNATPEQVKEIMVAFCQYAFEDKEPQVSGQINLLWGVLKGNIDRDRAQYIARCEQNRENANKRHNETVVYTVNGHEYELTYPKSNAKNIISEEDFAYTFEECGEDTPEQFMYLFDFVSIGNKDKWSKPYQEYEEEVWRKITNGTKV